MTFYAGEDWTAADANGLDTRVAALETLAAYSGVEAVGTSTQNLAASSWTKLNFASATGGPTGITWNGSNTATITVAGVYSGYAQVRHGGASRAVCFSDGSWSLADATMLFPGSSVAGYGDVHCSFTGFLNVGQTISAYTYNGTAGVVTTFGTRFAKFRLWRVA